MVVDDVVVVDDSWAYPAAAGARNTVTSAPATSARAGGMALVSARAPQIVEPAAPGREFVPRGVGVEKPARKAAPQRSPRDELAASIPHLGEVFHPRIRSSPPRLVDNVTPVEPTRSRPGSSAPSPHARTTWRCGRRWARSNGTSPSADYADRATRLAAGLRTLGVGPGDRVVMLIGNRPEFHVADMAALLLGATPISIYNSSSPEQIRYLAGHARGDGRHRREPRVPRPTAPGPRRASRRSATSSPSSRVDADGRRVVGRAARRRAASTSRPPPRPRSHTISPPSSTRRAPPGRRRA